MRLVPLTWQHREEEKDRTLLHRPIVIDRTRPVTVQQLWELSRLDRTLPLLRPVMIKLTSLVVVWLSRDLSGNDRTWQMCVRSWHCAASDHHLIVSAWKPTIEIKRLRLNGGNAWHASVDRTLDWVRPVDK